MSKHRKTESRAPRMSARQYVTTGVGGAAMFGVGLLLATPPGAPAPFTADVQLASTERMLPLAPVVDPDCLPTGAGCGGALFGPGVSSAGRGPQPPPFHR